ncbi:MAG TPA: DUF4440 domain-containing protein [Candidatus Eisenbacteria bacterium]
MRRAICLAMGLVLLGTAGCGGKRIDLEAERTKLRQLDLEWAAAFSAGQDVDRIISYWSDDAILLPPGQPAVSGKPAIRDYVARSLQLPGFRASWEPIQISLSPGGTVAYMFEKNQITMNDSTGASRTTHGKGLAVWRKDADGAWRCVAEAWNEDPAPNAPGGAAP